MITGRRSRAGQGDRYLPAQPDLGTDLHTAPAPDYLASVLPAHPG